MAKLRPLGLGELIDRSFNFWRSHWKPLFQLVLGFQLVTYVVVASSQGISRKLFPLASDPVALQKTPDLALPHLMGQIGMLTLASVVALYVSQVATVAITWFTWNRVTGRGTPGPRESFQHAAARFGSISSAFALSMAWSAGAFVLSTIPGAALGALSTLLLTRDSRAGAVALLVLATVVLLVAWVALFLWFVLRFILVSQIIAVEDAGGLAAFRRSNVLSSGRVGPNVIDLVKLRLTVLVTVMGVIFVVLTMVNSMPLLIVGSIYGANFNPGTTVNDVVPAWVLLPVQLLQTVAGSLIAPMLGVFQSWFFVDMKMRREGLDLELALEGRG
ncbi:MAG: hypothetical protein U0228_19710 [Myxococcaceae bacterium]